MITARALARRLRVGLLPVIHQALGLAVVVAVLGAALASVPLMVGSAEQGTWEQERARHPESRVGASLASSTFPVAEQPSPIRITRAAEFDAAVTTAAAEAGVGTPVFQARLRNPLHVATPDGPTDVQLVFRTGADDHVDVLAGAVSDAGVLVPQRLADATGVGPGDVLTAQSDAGLTTTVPITGVYAEPTAPLPAFWEAQGVLFLARPDVRSGGPPLLPPPVILASRDLTVSAAHAVQQDLFLQWFLPLEAGIGIDEARAAAGRLDQLENELSDLRSQVSRLTVAENYERPRPRTLLPDLLTTVDETTALLAPPVRAVGIGAGAAALVLVGAWAGQRIRRRIHELQSLLARGLSPTGGARQAVRESLVPVLVGAALGGGAAWLLVVQLGPSADLPAGAVPAALVAVALGGMASLLVIGGVTAVLLSRQDAVGPSPAGRLVGRLPWLAVTAAVAVATGIPVLTRTPEDTGRVDVLTLALPLLVAAVAAGVLTAVLPRIGRRADARLRRLPPGAFLALRRVLAGQGAARLVVVTTSLSLALVVYSGALGDSAARTVAVKASVAAGSDVVVPLVRRTYEAGPLPPGSTLVGTEEGVTLVPGELIANVLVVHPHELPGILRWTDALADRSLDELVGALADYQGDHVPVVVAGPRSGTPQPGDHLTLSFASYYSVRVEVVGGADAFPGQGSQVPLVVAGWDRFGPALEATGRDPDAVLDQQVWGAGQALPLLDALTASGYAYNGDGVTTADAFTARPEVSAQSWSLAYVRALALAAGVLGLAGLAMHALAQQRRRTVATLLLSRMGMSRRAAEGAVALELGLLTGLSLLVAVLVGLPASALVTGLLDPAPALPPEPLFVVPWGTLLAVLAGVVGTTVGSAVVVAGAARRATGGQVLRDAD